MFLVPNLHADRNLHKLGWELTFHDEFDAGPVKWWKWNQQDGPNENNNEKQWYTPDNLFITNGNLVIKSERRWINGWEYASGKVDTAGHFAQQFGYFEVRAKLPYGQGMWPAHWMLGYQGWPPEIDIMEFRGNTPNWVLFSVHGAPLPPGCSKPWECGMTTSADLWGPDFTQGFHTFAIDWDWWGVNWFVDDVFHGGSYGNAPQEPMWLILNTAVGGIFGGDPDWSTPFPGYHDIDWVRAWQKSDGRTILNPGFEDGDEESFMNWNRFDADFNVLRDDETVNAHSGEDAVQMFGRFNGVPNTSGLYQDFWAGQGEFVQASVYCQKRPGDSPTNSSHASLKLEFLDEGLTVLQTHLFPRIIENSSPDGYQYFALRHRAPVNSSRARIVLEYYQQDDDAGAVNFDDAGLDFVTAGGSRNLLNPGFEWERDLYFPNWLTYAAGTGVIQLASASNDVRSGSNGLLLTGAFNGTNNESGVYQDIPAKAGEEWKAEVWCKAREGDLLSGTNHAVLKLEFHDAAGTILQTNTMVIADTNTPAVWTTNSALQNVAPNGTVLARLVLAYTQSDDQSGSVVFDDAKLVPLSASDQLLNADFELHDGTDFPAWTRFDNGFNVIVDPASQNARSGTRAVQIFGQYSNSVNESGLYQELAAEQGEVWQASVWARNRPMDGAQGTNYGLFKLEFRDSGGGLLDLEQHAIITSNSPETFQEFILKRSAPTNTATARIVLAYVQQDLADGSVNYEDAALKKLTVDDDRPLLNKDFEEGGDDAFVNWPRFPAGNNNIIDETVPTNVLAGERAVQMFGRFTGGYNSSGLFQDSPAQEWEVWQASVWGKSRDGDPPAGPNNAKLKIEFVNDMDQLLATNQLTILDASSPETYEEFIIRRRAPAGTTRARMVVEYNQDADAGGSVNFDSAEMKLVTAWDADRPLLNGDFEVGEGAEFANWIRYAPQESVTNIFRDPEMTNAYSGSVAIQMHGAYDGETNNASGIFQNIPAKEGELWQASVWARNRPGDPLTGSNRAWLKLEFTDYWGNIIQAQDFVMIDAGSPEDYAWFALRYRAPAGTAFARIVLQLDQVDSAGGSVNIDKADLSIQSAIDEPATINGNFEFLDGNGNFVNWNEYGAGWNVLTDEISSHALEGSHAVKMFGSFDNGGYNNSGLYHDIPAAAGQLWKASAYARNRPGDELLGNNIAQIKLEFLDWSLGVIEATTYKVADAASGTNYAQYAIIRQAPAGTIWARIVLEMVQDNYSGGAVNFDKAELLPLQVLTGTQAVDRALLAGPLSPGIGEVLELTGSMDLHGSASIEMMVGGSQAGADYDQIMVSETATLNGELVISLPTGFSGSETTSNVFLPRLGDQFEILRASQVYGTFASVISPTGMQDSAAFTVRYFPTSVFIRVDHELDSDQDGLADFWELEHYGFPNAGSPYLDSDGDAYPNISEMIAGTIPTNASSYFRLMSNYLSGTNRVLEWGSISGKLYSVWASPNLGNDSFSMISNNIPAVEPANSIYIDTGGTDTRFYRVEVKDPSLQ